MNRRMLLLAPLALLLAGLACGFPGGQATPAVDTVATHVAATMAAIFPTEPGATGEPSLPPPTAPRPTSVPLPPPCPISADLKIAYTNGGNIWLISGTNPPAQLTFGGNADRVVISNDGMKLAFTTYDSFTQNSELRVINVDGSGEILLLSQPQLDALYPLDGALHHLVYRMAFQRCSQELLLNTRSTFEGPGLAPHYNLLAIDVNSAVLSTLLAPGTGGDFYLSPDGSRIAISQPQSIHLVNSDGSGYLANRVTFPYVITYSEFQWSPSLVWANNSSALGVVIPSADPLVPNPSGTVWIVPADGSAASALVTLPGQFYFTQAFTSPSFSPDLSKIAYLTPSGTPNIDNLSISNADGSGAVTYDTGELNWEGWNPDSTNFLYTIGTMSYRMGRLGSPPLPLGTGIDLAWINPGRFLYSSGSFGSWDLMLGVLGGGSTLIASPAGDFIDFDFAPHP